VSTTTHPGLDVPVLEAWLESRIEDARTADGGLRARLLAGGRSNVSYEIEQGGRRLVLRRPPLGNVLPSAHDMTREHRVLEGLSRVGFPVPHPVALCEDESVIGAPFMLMEFVDGVVIADERDASELGPRRADAVSANLIETLARLHVVDVNAAGLERLGRPEGYLSRQASRWSDQWQRTRTREISEMDELATWLRERVALIPEGLPWSIVHGDYRVDNVILDSESFTARAVLDWEMSTLGDPVSDLAIALVYWSEPGDVLRARVPVSERVTVGAGFWSRERMVEEYARTTGFDLAHLDTCIVLAAYKLAVIMESIHKRALQGQQVGTAATGMADAAPALARLALAATTGNAVAALGS
jgi:aminoglycoside phosphotransferase (APT) family kinase protein